MASNLKGFHSHIISMQVIRKVYVHQNQKRQFSKSDIPGRRVVSGEEDISPAITTW